MPKYRYTRALEGAPEGTVRTIPANEAVALLKSGALVEDNGDETPVPHIEEDGDKTLTSANVGGTKDVVAAPAAAAKSPRAARH